MNYYVLLTLKVDLVSFWLTIALEDFLCKSRRLREHHLNTNIALHIGYL